MNRVRLHELDAARGMAMLVVCIAHFMDVYALQPSFSVSWFATVVMMLCRIATPTFILVSGAVLGYQAAIKRTESQSFRIHLLDRAFFLVVVGHVLIALSLIPQLGVERAFSLGQITDTIAFCVVGGLLVIPSTTRRVRLLLGGIVLLGSWIVWSVWSPSEVGLLLIRSVFLGPSAEFGPAYLFPLLPWFGWYLIGSTIGDRLAQDQTPGFSSTSKRLVRVAFVMIGAVLVLKAELKVFQFSIDPIWSPTLSLYQKYPPGPLFLLLMGGGSILLLVFAVSVERWPRVVCLTEALRVIGRNSFAVFILQFYVYYVVLFYLFAKGPAVPGVFAWMLLVFSIVCVWLFSEMCHRHRVSKYITTGIPYCMKAVSESRRHKSG